MVCQLEPACVEFESCFVAVFNDFTLVRMGFRNFILGTKQIESSGHYKYFRYEKALDLDGDFNFCGNEGVTLNGSKKFLVRFQQKYRVSREFSMMITDDVSYSCKVNKFE